MIKSHKALTDERDQAVRAMNDAHESLRKSGEQDTALRKERDDLRSLVESKRIFMDQIEKELRRERDEAWAQAEIWEARNKDLQLWQAAAIKESDKAEALVSNANERESSMYEDAKYNFSKFRAERARSAKLAEALQNGDYNSVRETLALMAEGEGSDHKVYMVMAKRALTKLDRALAEYSKGESGK